jgi:protein TonB
LVCPGNCLIDDKLDLFQKMINKFFNTVTFRILILLIFTPIILTLTSACFAQENQSKTYLYTEVDELPVFGKSKDDLFNYIFSKLNWPKHFDGSGEVVISLIINEEGEIHNVIVVKNLCDECDKEAKTIIENMPSWKPGEIDGKPVKVKIYIPIMFVLK